jgi:hypothetical protein
MVSFNIQNSKLKNTALWLLGVLLLVLVLWIVFVLAGRALPHIAIGQIAELTNAKVQVKSIDFNRDGSVFIEKLVISPYRKRGPDDEILRAGTVYARFGLGSLLSLRPRLKEIDVNDFVFNAQYNLDTEKWNLAALKIKPRSLKGQGTGEMPLVNLERGKLQYSKVSNGRVKVVAAIPVDMKFGPAEEREDTYSFEITTAKLASGFGNSHLRGFYKPGNIIFAGGISSVDIPALEMAWVIEILAGELQYKGEDFSLKLSLKDFHSKQSPSLDKIARLAPSFLQNFSGFTALQGFFNRYVPAGCIDIYLETSGNLKRLKESKLAGKVYCKDVSVCDRRFQYPIEHLTGEIDFTEKRVSMNNLCGRHGDVTLFFNGWSGGFGADWQYETRMTSDNMILDKDLYDALNEGQKEFWTVFSPNGLAAIEYRLSRKSSTDIKKKLVVELLGTEARYKHFPYPLKNLSGKLFFEEDGITFSNVVSQVGEREIVVNGKAITAGTDRPKYDVTVDVNNIPLDSTLESALSDVQRPLYAQFRPSGLADGEIKVFSPEGDANAANYIADLSFRKSSLDSTRIPLVISDISAKAVFTNDSIRIDSFAGQHAGGLLCLTGQAWPDEKGKLRYKLKLDAKGAQLNEQLFDLLPEPLEKIVLEFQPDGKIDYKADLDKTDSDPNDYPDYNIDVTCLNDSVNCKWFPYPLKDVTGNLTVTKDYIKLRDIIATAAEGIHIEGPHPDFDELSRVAGTHPNVPTVKIDGEVVLADSVFSSGWFELSAGNILFNEQLGVALPEGHKALYSQLSPTGRFDVSSFGIKVSSDEDGEKYIDFDGTVRFKDCNLDLSAAVTGLDVELKTKGTYKTGEGFQWGDAILLADSLRVEGKAFTNLRADIYCDPDRQKWFTENLVADCYGGRLTGSFELTQPTKMNSEYLLQVSFGDVDIKQFLSDRIDKPQIPNDKSELNDYTTGKLNGSLSISGRSGSISSRIGKCKLAISDMQVGKLSPMAKLLQVLKLTEPKDYAFDQMLVDSYIQRDNLLFEKFDLAGSAVAFNGSGQMDLQSKDIELVLNARGERLATTDPSLLQSLAEGLGVAVVRMEVSGDVYNPQVEVKTLPVIEDSLQIFGTKKPEPES